MCVDSNNHQYWYINALNLADGTDSQTAQPITATVAASGDADSQTTICGTGNPNPCIKFSANASLQRAALLEVNTSTYGNLIYVAFGAGIDESKAYHGWVFPIKTSNLSNAFGPFATTPTGPTSPPAGSTPNCDSTQTPDPANPCGHGAGVWMTGRGPAANSSGDVFVADGNGGFLRDSGSNLLDSGESVLKFPAGTALPSGSATYFTPRAYATLNQWDWDLGIPGVTLFSNTYLGSSTPLAVTMDKQGNAYVMKQSSPGGYNSTSDQNTGSFQGNGALCTTANYQVCHEPHAMGLFNSQTLFVWPWFEKLAKFTYSAGNFGTPTTATSPGYDWSGYPGGMVSVTSNGTTNAIVWAVVTTQSGNNPALHNAAGYLVAVKASDLSCLWSSNQVSSDVVPSCPQHQADDFHVASFASPIVIKGRAYVPTYNKGILVYGTN